METQVSACPAIQVASPSCVEVTFHLPTTLVVNCPRLVQAWGRGGFHGPQYARQRKAQSVNRVAEKLRNLDLGKVLRKDSFLRKFDLGRN